MYVWQEFKNSLRNQEKKKKRGEKSCAYERAQNVVAREFLIKAEMP